MTARRLARRILRRLALTLMDLIIRVNRQYFLDASDKYYTARSRHDCAKTAAAYERQQLLKRRYNELAKDFNEVLRWR